MTIEDDKMYTKTTILILMYEFPFFAAVPNTEAIDFIQVKSAALSSLQSPVAVDASINCWGNI